MHGPPVAPHYRASGLVLWHFSEVRLAVRETAFGSKVEVDELLAAASLWFTP